MEAVKFDKIIPTLIEAILPCSIDAIDEILESND